MSKSSHYRNADDADVMDLRGFAKDSIRESPEHSRQAHSMPKGIRPVLGMGMAPSTSASGTCFQACMGRLKMASGIILIVEDNFIQREGLAMALRQRGFSVLPASDGQEAIELLEHSDPDLVLLDMLIPQGDRDGWWFLKQRQKSLRLASIPVFITTGITVASKEWAHSLGADELVRKPIDPGPLAATIERRLDGDPAA